MFDEITTLNFVIGWIIAGVSLPLLTVCAVIDYKRVREEIRTEKRAQEAPGFSDEEATP